MASNAFSQTGILSLPKDSSAVGLAYQMYNPPETDKDNTQARNIRGCLDWQFNKATKVSFIPGVAFLNTNYNTIDSIPPSPSFELRFTTTGAINPARTLDYFIRGAAQVNYLQTHRQSSVLHTVTTTLTGGIGCLYKLQTISEWQFNPFFGVFYSNVWQNISTTQQILSDDNYNLFTGEVGLEIEVSPTTHIIGAVVFSFETDETIYNIGVNFR